MRSKRYLAAMKDRAGAVGTLTITADCAAARMLNHEDLLAMLKLAAESHGLDLSYFRSIDAPRHRPTPPTPIQEL